MCTVAAAEGVVHISISQRSQLLAELGHVLGLFLAETGVLQQNDVAVVHGSHSSLCVLAHNVVVVSKHNGLAQLCAQSHSNGCQAELCLGAVLGLAQVAAQDDLSAIVDQLLDGGQSCVDAVLVGDDTVLHRDVEIAADKHLLAAVVLIVDRLLT